MKITSENGFKPINIRIETIQEARFFLALFNRAPAAISDCLEGQFSGDEILEMYRFRSEESWYNMLKKQMREYCD